MMQDRRIAAALGGLVASVWIAEARAAGFQVRENSTSGLGTAFAGAASTPEDFSTIYNNPAGMTRLSGSGGESIATVIVPSAQFRGSATRNSGGTVPGITDTDAGSPAFVPAGYAFWDLSPDVKVGLALTAPFGLKTSYPDTWVGRYNALTSRLTTINFNPNVAYRVTDWLSVGGGFVVEYAEAELSRALNLAFIGQPDGNFRADGHDYGFGWNAGVLLEPLKGTRLGATYRSQVTHKLEGDATFDVTPTTRALLGAAVANSGAVAKFRSPDVATFSLSQDVTQALTLSLEVQWTHWQTFRSLVVSRDSGVALTNQAENWNDSMFYAIGARYRLDDRLTLRTGFAFDNSAVEDANRTARIPDSDRIWLSVGAGYKVADWLSFNAGYTHIFAPSVTVRDVTPGGNGLPTLTGGTLTGTYEAAVDIISLSASLRF